MSGAGGEEVVSGDQAGEASGWIDRAEKDWQVFRGSLRAPQQVLLLCTEYTDIAYSFLDVVQAPSALKPLLKYFMFCYRTSQPITTRGRFKRRKGTLSQLVVTQCSDTGLDWNFCSYLTCTIGGIANSTEETSPTES